MKRYCYIWTLTLVALTIALSSAASGCSRSWFPSSPEIVIRISSNPPQARPGEILALPVEIIGKTDKVVWTASCLKASDADCQKVLWAKEGIANFFTAPDRPGEQVIISAVAEYKGKQDQASIVINVVSPSSCETADTHVTFDFPGEREQVAFQSTFKGSVTKIPSDCELWLVMVPHRSRNYHPQAGPAAVNPAGEWSSVVFVGAGPDRSIGEEFDVLAVLVDSREGLEFQGYLDDANQSRSWPGMTNLPQGSVVVARVNNIVRREGQE